MRRVVLYGILAGLGMALMACEGLLGYGAETRAIIGAVVGFCVYRGLANARQWDIADDGTTARMAKPPPPHEMDP